MARMQNSNSDRVSRSGRSDDGRPRARAATWDGTRDGLDPSRLQRAVTTTTTLRDRVEFLRGFVREPAQVGSAVPSSRLLEARILRCANIAASRSVVELGPGTGGTTRALLGAMPSDARLLAIELDPHFHQHVGRTVRDARFALQQGSAERLAEFLGARGMPAPDAIVSGIPFSTMPVEVSQRIARTIADVLAPGGRFVAYQVRAHVADFIRPHLGEPAMQWEWINVPPVRVFSWTKPA